MDNYIILPLYSMKRGEKTCFPKSSINQSNADGRERNLYEVYIPIPSEIRETALDFLPKGSFTLKSREKSFNVKTCQQDDKALMSNPNSDLGEWLFNNLGFSKEHPHEIVTYEELADTGFDSVKIEKNDIGEYTISLTSVGSYEKFLEQKKAFYK